MLAELGYGARNTALAYEAGSNRVAKQTVMQAGYNPALPESFPMLANVTYAYDATGNVIHTNSDGGVGITTTVNHYKAMGDADRQVYSGTTAPGSSGNVQTLYDGAGRIVSLICFLRSTRKPLLLSMFCSRILMFTAL